jgi:glc operon protein GlcG
LRKSFLLRFYAETFTVLCPKPDSVQEGETMARQVVLGLVAVMLIAASALAQAPAGQAAAPGASPNYYTIPIGNSITVDDAKKAVAAAIAEAQQNHWYMAAAVVDPDGELVYFERMDNVQRGSIKVAIGKARSSALYKRPTKVFETGVAGGGAGVRLLGLEGAVPLEGGLPIVVDGKLIGAIGLSGDLSSNDGKCAEAGINALAKK